MTHRGNRAAEDLLAVPEDPRAGIAGQMAGGDPHAGSLVAAACREDLLDDRLPEDHLPFLRSEEASNGCTHVVNQVVDDVVPAYFDALSPRLSDRSRLRVGLEGDDDTI